MYQEQRLENIVELLKTQEVLTTEQMIERFKVSRDTVRRDFAKLTNEGKVKRIHGGIMQLPKNDEISSFNDRLNEFTNVKKVIAQKANELIQPGGTYFFDVSTTVLQLAQLVNTSATIYTHSLDNSIMLSENPQIELHTLGGKFFAKNRFFYAVDQAEILEHINFDAVFIGAAGLRDGRISFEDQADAYTKQLVLKHAKTKILLAENIKFAKESTYAISDLSEFDYLITDEQPSIEFPSTLKIEY